MKEWREVDRNGGKEGGKREGEKIDTPNFLDLAAPLRHIISKLNDNEDAQVDVGANVETNCVDCHDDKQHTQGDRNDQTRY